MKINKKVIIISVSVLAVLAIGITAVGIIVSNTWKTARTIIADGRVYAFEDYTRDDIVDLGVESEFMAFYNKYGCDGIQYKIQGDKIIIRTIGSQTNSFTWEPGLSYKPGDDTVLVFDSYRGEYRLKEYEIVEYTIYYNSLVIREE